MSRVWVLAASLVTAASFATAAWPQQAPKIDHAATYDACLALADANPREAYTAGLEWLELGGGIPARHCLAVALVGLGDHEAAATRFEVLAGEIEPAERGLRAEMLAQAGQAWLLAGRPARAFQVQSEAIALSPEDPVLLVDRAAILLTQERTGAALADLDEAIVLDPTFADAYLYRASARRYIDDLLGARADVERAIRLAPGLPAALLERGILRQLDGDLDGARRDWLKVVAAAPDSPEAAAARARIEEMDVMR